MPTIRYGPPEIHRQTGDVALDKCQQSLVRRGRMSPRCSRCFILAFSHAIGLMRTMFGDRKVENRELDKANRSAHFKFTDHAPVLHSSACQDRAETSSKESQLSSHPVVNSIKAIRSIEYLTLSVIRPFNAVSCASGQVELTASRNGVKARYCTHSRDQKASAPTLTSSSLDRIQLKSSAIR